MSNAVYSTTAPIVEALASKDGATLLFTCQYCRVTHVHGRHGNGCPKDVGSQRCTCPVGSGNGHRVAHCSSGSPYRDGGYNLVEVAK